MKVPAKIPAKISKEAKTGKVILPCLRGRIGDWMYYSTLLPFIEIANRVSMADEIHTNKELSHWIQRKISDRIPDIVKYLQEQDQRFFNAIIVGIYGGKPAWQELILDKKKLKLSEKEAEYLDRTFGILRLTGEEKMFAIDGQHRAAAIKEAIISNPELGTEEVPVIFVAHRITSDGEIRTRRLFSTLNRYAKPVSISEIIALDEEDNAAILTRKLIEQYPVFNDKITFTKSKSLSQTNKKDFTNIILLYEIIITLLTDKILINSIQVGGHPLERFISRRLPEKSLAENYESLTSHFNTVISSLPFLKDFFSGQLVDRKSHDTNLLFRPVGQIIFFNAYRIASLHNKQPELIKYFSNNTFNLKHPVWKKLFIDSGTKNMITSQEVQRAALLLLLNKFNISFTSTVKDKSILTNLEISSNDI
jgi:DNA sulfur modification protein DndB